MAEHKNKVRFVKIDNRWRLTSPKKELTQPGTRLFLHVHALVALVCSILFPYSIFSFTHIFLGVYFHPTPFGKVQHALTGILCIALQLTFTLPFMY